MVLKQGLQVLLTVGREEERVDLGAKLPEGEVGGSEEGSTWMIGAVEEIKETSLAETELKSGELGWQEVDDLDHTWRREDEAVNAVDDTVGAELYTWLACTAFNCRRLRTMSIATMRL